MESVHFCYGYHYGNIISQGLMPVEKLRCLRNRFSHSNSDDICGRFFRVNAIKDVNGIWRQHSSGQKIEFHHFPEFNSLHGGPGDTLIWDAFLNRLLIQDEYDRYPALCYRQYPIGKYISESK